MLDIKDLPQLFILRVEEELLEQKKRDPVEEKYFEKSWKRN